MMAERMAQVPSELIDAARKGTVSPWGILVWLELTSIACSENGAGAESHPWAPLRLDEAELAEKVAKRISASAGEVAVWLHELIRVGFLRLTPESALSVFAPLLED